MSKKTTVSAQRLLERGERSGQTVAGRTGEDRRAVLLGRMTRIGVLFLVFTIGFYTLIYLQTRAWQILADMAGLALSILCLGLAHLLIRRRRLDAAGYWMLWTVLIVYGTGEMFWAGATTYFTVAVILLSIIAVNAVRPRRWGVWLVTIALYTIYVFLINQFEPVPRYDITQSPTLHSYVPGIVPLLALVLLWQSVRAYQHIAAIRIRLLISFVLVALLPVAVLVVTLLSSEFQSEQLIIIGGVALCAVFIAVIVSLFVTRSIATPLTNLAETTAQIAAGDTALIAKVEREDEIGVLARAFNSMTSQLRDLIGGLEQQVAARTADLEHRAVQLQAAAEVAREAATIRDASQLLDVTVRLISARFGFYHAGIFLLDEHDEEYTVLRAASSEGGRRMLARGHRLKVGEVGVVGYTAGTGEPRIALDVGADAVSFDNPDLPQTRSEMALPLKVRERVIGVLDVQSTEPEAFTREDMAVLQTLADLVAMALDNARLLAESQTTLEMMHRAYSELSSVAWTELLHAQPDLAYRSDESGVASASDIWRPEMERAFREERTIQGDGDDAGTKFFLAVPIKVREDVIGVLDTYKPSDAGAWTPEEIALLETLIDQLGLALESARLYRDTQRRAAHEQLASVITTQVRETLDVETVLQTAAREMQQALGLAEVEVRIGTGSISSGIGNNGDTAK